MFFNILGHVSKSGLSQVKQPKSNEQKSENQMSSGPRYQTPNWALDSEPGSIFDQKNYFFIDIWAPGTYLDRSGLKNDAER